MSNLRVAASFAFHGNEERDEPIGYLFVVGMPEATGQSPTILESGPYLYDSKALALQSRSALITKMGTLLVITLFTT